MDNNYKNNTINKLKYEENKEENIDKIFNYNFSSFNNQKKYNNYENDLFFNNNSSNNSSSYKDNNINNSNYNFRGDENTNNRFTSYTFMNINSNPTPIDFRDNEQKMNITQKETLKERSYCDFIRPTSILPINYNKDKNTLNPMFDRIPTIDTLNRNNNKK